MPTVIQPGLILYSRKEWGARTNIPWLGHPVNRLDRTEAIMHHTVIIDNDATPNRWETLAEVFSKMRQLQTIRPNLGLDVPYNFVAFHMADGSLVICEGRGFDRTGAHTHAHNTEGMATAGEGNFMIGQTVVPYVDHWSRWWGWLQNDEGMENLGSKHPTRGIAYGHRDFIATGCPGDELYLIIPQLTFKYQKEDDVPIIVRNEVGKHWILHGRHKEELTFEGLAAYAAARTVVVMRTDAQLAEIPDAPDALPPSGDGNGLSLEETIEANQEAARRGTG